MNKITFIMLYIKNKNSNNNQNLKKISNIYLFHIDVQKWINQSFTKFFTN